MLGHGNVDLDGRGGAAGEPVSSDGDASNAGAAASPGGNGEPSNVAGRGGVGRGGSAGSDSVGGRGGSAGGGGIAGHAGGGGEGGGESCGFGVGKSDFGNPCWGNSWWLTGCAVKEGPECVTKVGVCNDNDGPTPESKGARTIETFAVGGTPGQHYKVTFRFSAVTEAKFYTGGKRDSNQNPADENGGVWDTFYRDGQSTETNGTVLKLTIYDPNSAEARHYYMNSFPNEAYEAGSMPSGKRTFLAQYQKTIVIVGGGKIEHLVQDRDCRAVDNCGAGDVYGDLCNAPRNLPAPDGTLLLPAMYKDPSDGQIKPTLQLVDAYASATLGQPWHAQVAKLTVLTMEPTNDSATTDYP